ncbi:hypothetical protein DL240_11735 [Lujinxingia litoralis]|uniref:PpiC domain-containing protein n=1 Tax=Lujinxingia litoralis TaxID=2211119 RepID=A0A328C5P7_9DELT|nr:SurA N-terminal domain-containing protein [Lujinxingia litoralis]RAL21527.1 hypothetical protein DL240_11735 [Lujinxingia litoralis]
MNHLFHILAGKVLMVALSVPLWGCDPGEAPVETSEPPTSVPGVSSGAAPAPEARVIARVNQKAITEDEVERRLDRIDQLYHHARRPFTEQIRHQKRQEVLDRLIDHELLRQHLSETEVSIAPKAVDLEVERRVEEHFGSTTAFKRYLQAEGLSMGEFRREVHDEMVLERSLLDELGAQAVDEAQLREIYQRVAAGRPAGARVKVRRVSLPVGARSLATTITRGGCAPQALPAQADWRDLGWRQRHQLPAAASHLFFDAADAPGGRPSSVVLSSADGTRVDVYCVQERRPAGVRAFDEVVPLLRERASRALLEARRRELLHELREQAEVEVLAESPR